LSKKSKESFEGGRGFECEMDEGTRDNDVGDGRQVVDINSTNASSERGKNRKGLRGGEKREKRTHTEINDAILDERGGCLVNTSETLPDDQVQWYEREVPRREWVYTSSLGRTYRKTIAKIVGKNG